MKKAGIPSIKAEKIQEREMKMEDVRSANISFHG